MNPNYNEEKNTGTLADAAVWRFNNREQVKALDNKALLEEWAKVKKAGEAFTNGRVPWTDELFWCFMAFGSEVRDRGLDMPPLKYSRLK